MRWHEGIPPTAALTTVAARSGDTEEAKPPARGRVHRLHLGREEGALIAGTSAEVALRGGAEVSMRGEYVRRLTP